MAKRNLVLVGDPLSTGGAVLPHNHNLDTRKGVSFAYINGKVHCDTCNSIGVIAKAGGPSRLNFRGQEAALEGDIVLCKCSVPPTLVAKAVTTSKPGVWADDLDQTLGVVPPVNKAEWLLSKGYQPEDFGLDHKIRFHAVDKSGIPITSMPYKVTLADGTEHFGATDAQGMTKTIYTHSNHPAKLEIPYHDHSNSHSVDHTHNCAC